MIKGQNQIQRNFSRASRHYDRVSDFHRYIAGELIAQLVEQRFRKLRVLDIGTGTGWMLRQLKALRPDFCLAGVDSSPGMIVECHREDPQIPLILADATALPFQPGSFDFLISNLAYQWVADLRKAFSSGHAVLKKGGEVLFSLFGRRTFQELFSSLEKAFLTRGLPGEFFVERLADEQVVAENLCAAGFAKVKVSTQQEQIAFEDLFVLLGWIRALGGNSLKRNFYAGKDLLKKADDFYRAHFSQNGKIVATLEVIWASGIKNEDNKNS